MQWRSGYGSLPSIASVEGGGGKGWSRSRSCLYTLSLSSARCLLSSPTSARVQAVTGSRGRAQAAKGQSRQSAIREMRRQSQEAHCTPRHRSRHPAFCKHWPRSEAPVVFCMNDVNEAQYARCHDLWPPVTLLMENGKRERDSRKRLEIEM